MAGRGQHKTLPMEGKDMARFLASTVGSFIQDRLINRDQRAHHKDQCADRLAAAGPAGEEEGSVRYSDQAVLANLDWGIEALEEAIDTSNTEAKLARLDHAEKMLQVAAMLDPTLSTAGVPNSYLSAWAHLNLAFLWALRRGNGNGNGNANSPVLHVLEMFAVDPFFSRIDFAPELWKALFLPHMGSIVGWYSESRHRIIVEPAPDSADLSFIADDKFFDDDSSMLLSLRPDQSARLRQMEQIYGESLDDNTRLYAKYYKDCVNHDPAAAGGKMGMPMMPIAEPPMTPRHEVSRSIPDFVKFGPILPKSSGFNPALNPVFLRDVKNRSASKRRVGVTSTSGEGHGESTNRLFEEPLLEDNEEEIDSDGGDVYIDSETRTCQFIALNNMMPKEDTNSSPKVFSPVDSPKTPSPRNISSPKPVTELELLSLLSGHSTSLRESQHLFNDLSVGSCDFDGEMKLQKSHKNSSGSRENTNTRSTMNRASENNSFHAESEEEVSPSNISLPSSERSNLQTKPPKDFVCPITGQLFVDPVTLETGQTYERRAIHEWIKRGNTTCPITRQPLSATVLPKTNYVLKRLINSWKEQLHDISRDFSFSETPSASLSPISSRGFPSESTNSQAIETELPQTISSSFNGEIRSKRFMRARVFTSPTSVISQAAVETVINGLEPYTSCLCTSEELQACEAAVLAIARIWKDSKVDPAVLRYLSKPAITNGFVELLSASMNREVLRTSIYILSELISADESIAETLTSVDSDFDCLANLLKNGLAEAATLIYQLRPAFSHLSNHDLIPSLVQVIMSTGIESNDFRYVMEPKDSAIALLEQILLAGDENSRSLNALNVISENGLPALVKCLDQNDGRLAVVSILLSCMRADRSCTNLIANRADLAPVLELFHAGNDSTRSICIDFLSELVRLNRRTVCNQILQIIKDEGAFSTMHTFLVYLQMAPMEQQSVVACLLLQLDLLVEPRKMSIYREEAIETLIEALNNKDFPICQTIALDALSSLSGRLSASGKPLLEAWLLNSAGLDQPFNNLVKEERMGIREDVSLETMEEEEKATSAWEKRVAFVLCNHDNGSIFKALEECLRSNSLELAKSCLVIATWLTHMLSILPDTGIRVFVRHSFLDLFINVLQSSRSLEERVLASLALKSFISDKDALEGLGMYAKSIWKPLRNLRRCSVVAADTLKALTSLPHVDTTELWSCTEIADIDTGANGEVLSLVHLKGHVFSSHSDGMIKVWDAGKRGLRLIQELRDHTKAVTCLFVPSSGDKLYSGSLDRTIRVWAIEPEEIHCVQVHDVKEPVHWLACSNTVACFTSQGTGIKIYNWGGVPKHVNFSKNVKCLAIAEGHLYCGCSCSIQEVDLSRCTTSTLFSGPRKLLGKQSILALCVHDNLLFAGGSSVEGTAGKVFSLSAKATIGSFLTGHDIHSIAVNGDFVFTGTKSGIIEVWLRERLARIASIKVGGGANSKVMSLASDSNGEMLFAGSSDGRIQVWSLD